ncbi:hypothetical protein [Marispirochaeta aestuarii]|uniref:hypothetical protein n=1 Tax=Marispirochaeta aestuarii TaxID=1963862 RepID=UPI0029C7C1C0|nr:hypothetical protein [Marispirochaeta aestuarii]
MRIIEPISEIVERSKQIPDVVERYRYFCDLWESCFKLGNEISSSKYHPYCLLISNEINTAVVKMIDQAKRVNPAHFKEICKTRLLELSKIPDYLDDHFKKYEKMWIENSFIVKIQELITAEKEKLPMIRQRLHWGESDELLIAFWYHPRIRELFTYKNNGMIEYREHRGYPAALNTILNDRDIQVSYKDLNPKIFIREDTGKSLRDFDGGNYSTKIACFENEIRDCLDQARKNI